MKINEVSGGGHVIKTTSGDIETLQLTKKKYKQLTTAISLYLDKVKQIETVNNQTSLSFRNAKEAAESYLSKIERSNIKDGGVLAQFDEFKRKLSSGGFTNEKQLNTELAMLKRRLEDVGATGESAFSKLRKFFTTRFGSIAVSTLFYGLIRQIKECIQTVVELDSAVTDLQIATGYSKEQTRELIREYSALAVQLGATTTEVAAAADEWLRQGHSAEDATKLVNDSMMLSKLGQIDSAEATKALTSAMKGYKVEVDDVAGIVDRLTAVDMQAATSAGDIATAMAETATSARLAGVDMNTLIGYLTVVQEVTQDGAESVGTFMKTTLARYSNIKAGALTDPETSEDLSNVENALKGVGIQIRSASGEFRDFDEVLDDVQANWKSYSSVQQSAIAIAFGGTRNREKFLTLMDNYNTALKYSETAANSAGTAQQKYAESYLTSIEAAKNAVAASKEQYTLSIANSDLAVKTLNIVAQGLSALAKFNELGSGVTAAVTTGIVGLAVATTAFVIALKKKVVATYESIIADNLQNKTTEKSVATLAGKSALFRKLMIETGLYTKEEVVSTAATAADTIAHSADAAAAESNAASKIKLTAITKNLTIAMLRNAAAAVAQHPVITAVTVAVVAATAAMVAYLKSIETADDAMQKLEDTRTDLSDKRDELSSLQNELKANKDRINELRQIEVPSIVDQNEIKELTKSNFLLKTRIDLLEKEVELKERDEKNEENSIWQHANSLSYGNDRWYDNGDKASGFEFWFQRKTGSVDEDGWMTDDSGNKMSKVFYTTVEAAELYAAKLAALQEQETEYLSAGYNIAGNEHYDLWEENQKALDTYSASLSELVPIMENAGDAGADLLIKINFTTAGSNSEKASYLYDYIKTLGSIVDESELTGDKLLAMYNEVDDSGNYVNATLREMINALAELYGVDTPNTVDEMDLLIGVMQKVTGATTEVEESVVSYSSKLKNLTGDSAKAVGSLQKLVQSFRESGEVNLSDLESLADKLTSLNVNRADELVKNLFESSDNAEDFAKAVDKATDALIQNIISTKKLAMEDEGLLAALLDEQGVLNAQEVAHKSLVEAKARSIVQAGDFSNITEEEIKSLEDELVAIGSTREALAKLAFEELAYGNTKLDVSQKIEALKQLCAYYGLAAEFEAALNKSYAETNAISGNSHTWYTDDSSLWGTLDEKSGMVYMPAPAVDPNTKGIYSGYDYDKLVDELSDEFEELDEKLGAKFNEFGTDELDAWNGKIKKLKHQLETDEITKEEYYATLKSMYDQNLYDIKDHADEVMAIEEELYQWQKDKVNENLALEESRLEYLLNTGAIDQAEYERRLLGVLQSSYSDLQGVNFGADEAERLQAENEMLERIHDTTVDNYEAEKKELDHQLAMNTISQEEYYSGLRSLYEKYYKDKAGYEQESYEAQEELYDQEIELAEKWATAATDSIEAVSKAMEEYVNSTKELLEGLIDANESSYNREKSLIDHQLAMNYITEDEYYKKLEDLYKTHFADKYIYMEQYWEAEEDIYKYETQALEDNRSAMESIHGEIIEMIKQELEDAKDAINETKDAYQELIDVRKKALSDQKSQEDYERERAKKLAEVEELQRQLDAVSGDSSAAGIKRRSEIQQSLTDAQEAFYDFEREHSYDTLDKSLDEQNDAITAAADSEIKSLEELLNDNEYLVSEAWKRMGAMNNTLYEQLIAYNKKYSTSIKDDITENWNAAADAARRYGADAQAAYNSIGAAIDSRTTPYTDEDARRDETNVALKNTAEYAEVSVDYIADIASTTADLSANLVQILADITGNPYAGIAADVVGSGATSLSSIFGALTGIMSFAGGLASGSSNVQKTGVYRTDESAKRLNF